MSGQSTPRNKVRSSFMSQTSYNIRNSPSKFRFKKKKTTQLTLAKRGLYRVYDSKGVERTPKLLHESDYQILEEWQPTVLDYVNADLTSSVSQMSISRSYQPQPSSLTFGSRQASSQLQQHSISRAYQPPSSFNFGSRQPSSQQPHSVSLQMSFANIANLDSYKELSKTLDGDVISYTRSNEGLSEAAPSAFRLKTLPSREFYPPHSKVPLIAKETESFTLFSLNSVVQSSTADDIEVIKADNKFYEYITVGKGKYTRKMYSSEQQTPCSISTSEVSYCPRMPTKNDSCWVTLWKLFDEYSTVGEKKRNYLGLSFDDQWSIIADDDRFVNVGIIMDRILGAPTFREIQLAYRTFRGLNPMDLNVTFSYSAQKLWTYQTPLPQKKSVTAIAINKHFSDIVAVGYGKFQYNESDRGFIGIWCVKNLKHPERLYRFMSSVTCLDFSQWTPNFLAVGFFNGDLFVLDISSVDKKIIYTKDSFASNTYESIMFTKWWIYTNLFGIKDERLMVTTRDGRIIQFRRKVDRLIPFQMMRISKTEGKVKGIDCLQKCDAEEIIMARFPAAWAVVRYPDDDQFYLVSGDDGTIHKCSTNFFSQHVESFLAHSGPVYALKFSPFCNKIFLTCGADGAVRLWVWDVFEPVITLTLGPKAVEDAAWSPRNSFIIASICEANFYLWDLRRKTYYPASTYTHPENIKFTCLEFTETGNNILLGDVEGSVIVMALYGMPFEEKFKENILAASIEKELTLKPKLLKILKKMGPPFSL